MLRYHGNEEGGGFRYLPGVKTERRFLLPVLLEGSSRVIVSSTIPGWAERGPFTRWQGGLPLWRLPQVCGDPRDAGCLLCLICAIISAQRQLVPDAAYQCLLFSVVSCWEMGPTKGRGRER